MCNKTIPLNLKLWIYDQILKLKRLTSYYLLTITKTIKSAKFICFSLNYEKNIKHYKHLKLFRML